MKENGHFRNWKMEKTYCWERKDLHFDIISFASYYSHLLAISSHNCILAKIKIKQKSK